LLWDYPEPQRAQILDYLFKPSFGAALSILKVEIGGDAQSTDGTEPSHMHTRDDLSCARGYETWLIAEAKKRNPAILTYTLQWAAPAWVGDGEGNGTGFYSSDNYVYLVKWLECVRNSTGATVDVLGTWNEKPPAPTDYVKGLRAALDAAGFAATRLSIFDNDYSLNNLVAQAVADPAFNASFDSVGRHYPCNYPGPAIEAVLHKAYWASEDSSAANDWAGASCWAMLLNQNYLRMNVTATIAWSLIWSASTGLPFAGSGLMSAQQPWSAHYSGGDGVGGATAPAASLNGPLWTTAHTTQFVQRGWRYLLTGAGGSGQGSTGASPAGRRRSRGSPASNTTSLRWLGRGSPSTSSRERWPSWLQASTSSKGRSLGQPWPALKRGCQRCSRLRRSQQRKLRPQLSRSRTVTPGVRPRAPRATASIGR
jgi:galactosylceramidase